MTAQNTPAEFTTTRGRRVALGQHYRDNRDHSVRDLVVERIGVHRPAPLAGIERPAVCTVTCSIRHETAAGTTLGRPVTLPAEQLTGGGFVLVGPAYRPVVTTPATGGVL